MDYKISIITAVYNGSRFIQKSFDSLRRQSIGFKNLQVIYADDCSTDDSIEIITRLAEEHPNVEFVRLPENSGFGGAPRNAALELAKAKYFMILDVDDELSDDACLLLYNAIEKHKTDFAFGYINRVDSSGNILSEKDGFNAYREQVYSFPADLEFFLANRYYWQSTIYKKSFWDDCEMKLLIDVAGEDVEFSTHYLFCSSTAVYVDKLIYNYTIHTDSVSHSKVNQMLIGQNKSFRHCRELFEKYGHMAHFGIFADHLLTHLTYQLLKSPQNLSDTEIREVFEQYKWLWEYCAANNVPHSYPYTEALSIVFFTDVMLDVYKCLRKLMQQNDETIANLERYAKSIEHQLKNAKSDFEASTSWRLTAPLRAASGLLRGNGKK